MGLFAAAAAAAATTAEWLSKNAIEQWVKVYYYLKI